MALGENIYNLSSSAGLQTPSVQREKNGERGGLVFLNKYSLMQIRDRVPKGN